MDPQGNVLKRVFPSGSETKHKSSRRPIYTVVNAGKSWCVVSKTNGEMSYGILKSTRATSWSQSGKRLKTV